MEGCKSLYTKATGTARTLGHYEYVRSNPLACHLVLIKRRGQRRHPRTVHGKPVRSCHSLKQARAQREPWLWAASPGLAHPSAQAVGAVYAQRMQIEEAFRDLKSARFGLGFCAHRSTHKDRLAVLWLIASLASFVLRLIGETAKTRQLEFQFQSNTRRSRAVLSVVSLALQLIRKGMATFSQHELNLNTALRRLRYCHPALQI